jgi:hypothetical protein
VVDGLFEVLRSGKGVAPRPRPGGWVPTPRSAPAPRGAVRKPELKAHKSAPIFGSLGKRPGKPSLEVKLPPPDGARDAWVDAFSVTFYADATRTQPVPGWNGSAPQASCLKTPMEHQDTSSC